MRAVVRFLAVPVILILIGCETFPENPSKTPEPKGVVSIEHTATEYVPATHPVVGVNANKTNVLFFNISVANIEVHSVEFMGRAMVESGEGLKEHAIHFRTDEVVVNPKETGYTFNTLDCLEPSMKYTVVRSKFPTNDYAPFEGDMGKIKEVFITDVWAYNDQGDIIDVGVD